MFFLFNDVVFDIDDPRSYALEQGAANGYEEKRLKSIRYTQVMYLVKKAVFEDPSLPQNRPGVAAFLSSLVAWKTNEANAMIALPAIGARNEAMVVVKLASISLVTMAQLSNLQTLGRLNSQTVNASVWSQIAQSA
jgi:hypothetical protein